MTIDACGGVILLFVAMGCAFLFVCSFDKSSKILVHHTSQTRLNLFKFALCLALLSCYCCWSILCSIIFGTKTCKVLQCYNYKHAEGSISVYIIVLQCVYNIMHVYRKLLTVLCV